MIRLDEFHQRNRLAQATRRFSPVELLNEHISATFAIAAVVGAGIVLVNRR